LTHCLPPLEAEPAHQRICPGNPRLEAPGDITQKMIDHDTAPSPFSEQAADQYPDQHCADHALTGMCGASSKKLVTSFVSSRS
jgi:hypothetical protein